MRRSLRAGGSALLIAALPFLAPTGVAADDRLVGRATVTDGDTIRIRDQKIRLDGIDAPESAQLCGDAEGRSYRCGQVAALFLDDMLLDRTVNCNELGVDRYKRILAECFIRIGDDPRVSINAMMVFAGHALAYRRYSAAFVGAEDAARAARRGVWQGAFQAPWDWRKERKSRK